MRMTIGDLTECIGRSIRHTQGIKAFLSVLAMQETGSTFNFRKHSAFVDA